MPLSYLLLWLVMNAIPRCADLDSLDLMDNFVAHGTQIDVVHSCRCSWVAVSRDLLRPLALPASWLGVPCRMHTQVMLC